MITPSPTANAQDVTRDIAGETVHGFRVAAYRETHPEHGDKYGHTYSEHWSTPNTRNPAVRVERLFTETQLLKALTGEAPAQDVTATLVEALKPFAVEADAQERVTSFSSGDCIILRTKITIGDLCRARAALAKATAA